MMTDTLRASVVAAPLAAIDPRALSQAWYSALRLARASAGEAAVEARSGCVADSHPRAAARPIRATARTSPMQAPVRPTPAPAAARPSASERCAPAPNRRQLRRVETAPVRRPDRPVRASFVLTDGSKRALIVVQTRGSTTHLVALCAPSERASLALALAHLRGLLLVRGIDLRSRVEAGPACS